MTVATLPTQITLYTFVRSRRVGSGRGVCGVARLARGINHGPRRAPCIRSLAEPTRLARNTQTGSYAQHPIYGQVRDELQGGQKETHWMWFIFPQIKGLGSSPTAFVRRVEPFAPLTLSHPASLRSGPDSCPGVRNSVAHPCARSTTVAQRRDSGPPPGFLARMGLRIRRYVLVARVLGRSIEDIFGYPDQEISFLDDLVCEGLRWRRNVCCSAEEILPRKVGSQDP
jgi:hypothetical protein